MLGGLLLAASIILIIVFFSLINKESPEKKQQRQQRERTVYDLNRNATDLEAYQEHQRDLTELSDLRSKVLEVLKP